MTLFRRHDRYVLKAFWASFGAIVLFFTVIVIVVHLADRSGRLMRYVPHIRKAGYDPVMVVIEYYATLIPFAWNLIIPVSAPIAAASALSRLTRHNELGPLVISGVSTPRIALPILLSGLVLSAGLFAMQETLTPSLSRRHLSLSRLLNQAEPDRVTRVPHFDDSAERPVRLSMAAYQPSARRMEEALLTVRNEDGTLRELRYYPLVGWEDEREEWVALEAGTLFPMGIEHAGMVRTPLPSGEEVPIQAGVRLLEVSVLKDHALGFSTSETAALVRADPDNPRLQFLHHERYAACLVSFVLLLLAVPFCLRLGRRSAIPGTIAALAAAALVYGLAFFAYRLAASGELNAVVMAWLPVVLGTTAGTALLLSMRT
jgi:lipopolysaccharide export LptBFGC system permease protein LptF